jgi:butyrate kinase
MIGEMAVVLRGNVDGILITGGMAFNSGFIEYLKSSVSFIAEIFVHPGEDELEALAINALSVARGEVNAKEYIHP